MVCVFSSERLPSLLMFSSGRLLSFSTSGRQLPTRLSQWAPNKAHRSYTRQNYHGLKAPPPLALVSKCPPPSPLSSETSTSRLSCPLSSLPQSLSSGSRTVLTLYTPPPPPALSSHPHRPLASPLPPLIHTSPANHGPSAAIVSPLPCCGSQSHCWPPSPSHASTSQVTTTTNHTPSPPPPL